MKYLHIALACLLLIFSSCQKAGCNDPNATNYSSEAQKDDGSCLYSPEGQWNLQSYILNGDDLTSAFSVYKIEIFSDNSYLSEAQVASSGAWVGVIGVCSFNNTQTTLSMNNTEVNYYDNNGWVSNNDYSNFDINSFTSSTLNLSLSSSSNPSISSLEIILQK
tara:strand:+ start:325 stop:813 length:489 start_codon:yes stop_codon:yes gene_type:complete